MNCDMPGCKNIKLKNLFDLAEEKFKYCPKCFAMFYDGERGIVK
jgi:hypothetical protein